MKENRKLSDALWADCETDEERVNFLIAGRGFETGIIAKAVQHEVAMAFQFRSEIIKERMENKAAPEECEHKGRSWFHVGQPCPKCG